MRLRDIDEYLPVYLGLVHFDVPVTLFMLEREGEIRIVTLELR